MATRLLAASDQLIEGHYGALLDGSGAEIAGRLDQLDALDREDAHSEGGG